MHELYSVKQTARIFGLRPSQLRYWTQTGFVTPTVRKKGRLFYTFRDLIGVKTAVELLNSGLKIDDARPSLDALRKTLPREVKPQASLRVACDGQRIVLHNDDGVDTGSQPLLSFPISQLRSQVEAVMSESGEQATVVEEIIHRRALGTQADAETSDPVSQSSDEVDTAAPQAEPASAEESAPGQMMVVDSTEPHGQPSAYEAFLEGYRAEEKGDFERAILWYSRAVDAEPSMAAAHTNLGNLYYERGSFELAKNAYETALEHEPNQAEARFNLGNLLDEEGDPDAAIQELRRVVAAYPGFADAHYNLGLYLLRVGGVTQARAHLGRYVDLDPDSPWAERARELLRASS